MAAACRRSVTVAARRRGGSATADTEPFFVAKESEDLVVVDYADPLRHVLDLSHPGGPEFVIIRRPHGGKVLNYAFRPSEVVRLVGDRPILDVLQLKEENSSAEVQGTVTGYAPQVRRSGPPSEFRGVVVEGGEPIAVIHTDVEEIEQSRTSKLAMKSLMSGITPQFLSVLPQSFGQGRSIGSLVTGNGNRVIGASVGISNRRAILGRRSGGRDKAGNPSEIRPEIAPEVRPEIRPDVRRGPIIEVAPEVRPDVRRAPETIVEVAPEVRPEIRPGREALKTPVEFSGRDQAGSKSENEAELSGTSELRTLSLAAAQIECHFLAELSKEIVIAKTSTLSVTVSRELVEASSDKESKRASSARVKEGVMLIVEAWVRRNLRIVGETRVELNVPAPNASEVVYFDVIPSKSGPAEVMVVVRQGALPLARLDLQVTAVEQRPKAVGTARVAAIGTTADNPPAPSISCEFSTRRMMANYVFGTI
jgi:hypothetical protein